MSRSRAAALLLSTTLLVAGCGQADPSAGPGDPSDPGDRASTPGSSPGSAPGGSSGGSSSPGAGNDTDPGSSQGTGSERPRVVGTVAKGLAVPWGMAFLPDGSAVVTERDSGRVLLLRPTGKGTSAEAEVEELGRVDEAEPEGEAGLLGVAVSPTFTRDRRLFLYVTADDDNRVLRTTLEGGRLGAMTPIVRGIPKASYHDGGRMIFGPDGRLYIATGDAGRPDLAQDPDSLGGKVLRVDQDGRAPADNPQPGSPIWSSGHRNIQGLAFDDQDRLWASEFGQNTWDELNLIERGRNYGWPLFEGRGGAPDFADPAVQWRTEEASPSGLAFADGRLWMAALRGERLWRIDVDGDRAGREQGFLEGDHGRLRTVVTTPQGALWVATSNRDGRGDPAADDDRILLVSP